MYYNKIIKINQYFVRYRSFFCYFTLKSENTIKNNHQYNGYVEENMLKKERETEIINILKAENGYVSVKDLCKKLYASESSIRRDLTSLEKSGLITRSYGGAELIVNFSNVIEFDKRSRHNSPEKKIIAKKAKALIKDGNIIFLDQSSTSFYLANEIIDNHSLTVITNNTAIISLMANSGIKTIASGGSLSNENRTCLVGPDAQYIFENIHADIMFFSAKSLSFDGIISDCTREEILIRKSMLNNANIKVFLCDSEKIGTHSPYNQCKIDDIDYLICENDMVKHFSNTSDKLKIL